MKRTKALGVRETAVSGFLLIRRGMPAVSLKYTGEGETQVVSLTGKPLDLSPVEAITLAFATAADPPPGYIRRKDGCLHCAKCGLSPIEGKTCNC